VKTIVRRFIHIHICVRTHTSKSIPFSETASRKCDGETTVLDCGNGGYHLLLIYITIILYVVAPNARAIFTCPTTTVIIIIIIRDGYSITIIGTDV